MAVDYDVEPFVPVSFSIKMEQSSTMRSSMTWAVPIEQFLSSNRDCLSDQNTKLTSAHLKLYRSSTVLL